MNYQWRAANCQILTNARHLWPFSSEGSSTCLAYSDTGPSVYNGHLRRPVTITPNAERLGLELTLPVFTTRIRTPNLQHARPIALIESATAAAGILLLITQWKPTVDNILFYVVSPLSGVKWYVYVQLFIFYWLKRSLCCFFFFFCFVS